MAEDLRLQALAYVLFADRLASMRDALPVPRESFIGDRRLIEKLDQLSVSTDKTVDDARSVAIAIMSIVEQSSP